jgi:dephospho-CoA kinase
LFESGFDKYVDMSINVHADKNIRLKRVMERDNVDADSVLSRMNHQLDDMEKIKRANFTIYNNYDQMIIQQVLNIHENIKNKTSSN